MHRIFSTKSRRHCVFMDKLNRIQLDASRKHINNNVSSHRYEDAIDALNGLQSNAAYLRNKRAENVQDLRKSTIESSLKFLNRLDISIDDIDQLPTIHVTGTKGKGSTCAAIESILQYHGLRTGMFSSPHLIEVRERIRINGQSLSRSIFAENFWQVYDSLQANKAFREDMPQYFCFLTLMAFRVFVQSHIDVAIIEVGIGGEYDYTNILRRNVIGCVTPIAFDHMPILGTTLSQIAWNKGGIFKKDMKIAWSAPQRPEVVDMLNSRSEEKECKLQYLDFEEDCAHYSAIMKLNSELATQVANSWLLAYRNHALDAEKTKRAIEACNWKGRFQTLKFQLNTFYLDGAHTKESIDYCVDWFQTKTETSKQRALIFNSTGNRNYEEFFKSLTLLKFETIYFVPNFVNNDSADNKNLTLPMTDQLARCEVMAKSWRNNDSNGNVVVMSSVTSALDSLAEFDGNVLVTGSLHLVGCVLSVIDPNLEAHN